MKKATLVLSNGMTFDGWSFGYEAPAEGEVVFSTAMVGYPESLTDPSYSGQILCVSYPLVGNYGIPPMEVDEDGLSRFFESERIHVRALVISYYSETYSHYDAVESLGQWLREQKIPAICGVDTRELIKTIREQGAMLGAISIEGSEHQALNWAQSKGTAGTPFPVADPNKENQVDIVSCKEVIRYGFDSEVARTEGSSHARKRVVLVDCGVKHQIIRCLLKRGIEVIRVPWDYDFNSLEWDGLFISNGPGNPDLCEVAVEHIREALKGDKPIFGICMGNQLLAKAAGAQVYKLSYGHRSHNQPVRLVGGDTCYITSQNHGFAVDDRTLPEDWEPYFVNMNDGTNEGIRHRSKPFFSAQFHPEASSGPVDTEFLFDQFISKL